VLNAAIAVVTNVERDHCVEAGGGRAVIAAEKAQIVRPGGTLILGETDGALRRIFARRAPARVLIRNRDFGWAARRPSLSGSHVDLTNPWGRRRDVRIGMLGAHQCDNAAVALTAAEAFLAAPISHASVDEALAHTRVPGRFEIRHHAPLVVLDGAHNAAAALALRRAVSEVSLGMTPRVLVYGLRDGRDPASFLRECGIRHVDRIFVTEADHCPDACHQAATAAQEFGTHVVVVEDPTAALQQAVRWAGPEGLVVATGSLRLVGEFREVRLGGYRLAGRPAAGRGRYGRLRTRTAVGQ
jgi:dihydrofolate synthase/folylpolyglutamate synthase